MTISFSSSDEFKADTKALAKHVKPMKLNQLRHALAAFAGYNSVEAYMASLDRTASPEIEVLKALDEHIFIYRDEDFIRFQGLPEIKTHLHLSIKGEWEEEVQQALVGSVGKGRVDVSVVDGTYYPNLLIKDESDTNSFERLSAGIHHFIKLHEARAWPGEQCMSMLREHVIDWVKRTCQGEETPIREMIDLADETDRRLDPEDFEAISVDIECGHIRLPEISDDLILEAVGHYNAEDHKQDFQAADGQNWTIATRSLAQRILSIRAARMFQTMMNRLCVNGKMDVRGRDDLAMVFQRMNDQIHDDLAVAFFLEEAIEYYM